MRGSDAMQESLFTVAKLDDFVPADHPLRTIRTLVNTALGEMNARFNEISRELVLIQAALDRMVATLSDAISILPGQEAGTSEEASS